MIQTITEQLKKSAERVGISDPLIKLDHPEDMKYGDFSSNIAMMHAKSLGVSPKVLAGKIIEEFKKEMPEGVESVEIAGPGFINFKIADTYFANQIIEVSKDLENFGKIKLDDGKKIMVEYTDPNPFKVFHIGHLMANTIGESISKIVEFSGAEVIRACYQGDVGLHVAKTIWAVCKSEEYKNKIDLSIKYLGDMYVLGSEKYETDEIAKKEIIEINKKDL